MNPQADEEKRYRSVLELDLRRSSATEALVQLLYDESWRVRGAAVERLAHLPDRQRAVPSLLAALADRGQAGARNSAAEALTRLGVAAAPAVIALMSHPDPDQRRFAADILGGMRLREAAPVLIGALKDGDQNVRIAAAEALGRIGGDAATSALKELLNATDPLIRLCCLQGLAELKCPLPLPQLLPFLGDARARRTAYCLLGLIADAPATDLVCEGLASGQRSVAEAALAALGMQRALLDSTRQQLLETRVRGALARIQTAREILENALGDADRDVRVGALFAAAVLQEPSLAPSVAEVARDEHLGADVRRALAALGPAGAEQLLARIDSLSGPARVVAAECLVELADSSHVAQLTGLAERADAEIQLLAIKALGQCGAVEAVRPLVRMLGDDQLAAAATQALLNLAQRSDWAVLEELERLIGLKPAAAAIWALARVGKARALPTLLRTIRDEDPRVRAASVEAAAEIGNEAAIELARIGLADDEAAVRCAAARALGAVSPAASEPLLRRALADPDAWVQAAAIESAGENKSTQLAPDLEQHAASVDGLRAGRAVRALAGMKKLSPALWHRAIAHRDAEVIKEALLACPPGPEAASIAAELLSHSRWDVRAAAARVLLTSGSSDVRPLLSSALERETDALAREALSEVLSHLSPH